jgi:hypothetical protein
MLNPSEEALATRIIRETNDPNLAVIVLFLRAVFPQLEMKAIDYAGMIKLIDDEVRNLDMELSEDA